MSLSLILLVVLAACGQADPQSDFETLGNAVVREHVDRLEVIARGGPTRTAEVLVDGEVVAKLTRNEKVDIFKADYPRGEHELTVISSWEKRGRSQTQTRKFMGEGDVDDGGDADRAGDDRGGDDAAGDDADGDDADGDDDDSDDGDSDRKSGKDKKSRWDRWKDWWKDRDQDRGGNDRGDDDDRGGNDDRGDDDTGNDDDAGDDDDDIGDDDSGNDDDRDGGDRGGSDDGSDGDRNDDDDRGGDDGDRGGNDDNDDGTGNGDDNDGGRGDDDDGDDDRGGFTPAPADSCLAGASRVAELTGRHSGYDNRDGYASGTVLDNSGATFNPGSETTAFRLYEATGVCITGGTYDSQIDADARWDHAKQHTAIAFRYSDDVVVENAAILNTGDGVSFGEDVSNWTLRSSYINRTMDDAVENDYLETGLIDDVLIDHTYAFVSSRTGSSRRNESYPGGVVTVQNSIVRLAPQNDADGGFSGGRLWKWEKYAQEPAKLVVKNNIFVFEEGDFNNFYLDPADDRDIDYNPLLEAEGNIVVWLGRGSFPARVPEGFTVVTDRSVYENARADWFDAHPQFAQYE